MSIFKNAAFGNSLLFALPIGILGFLLLAFLMSSNVDPSSPLFYIGLVMMIAGYGMLVRSKWDQLRKCDFTSYGISKSRPQMQRLYRLSYVCMIGGWLIVCLSGYF